MALPVMILLFISELLASTNPCPRLDQRAARHPTTDVMYITGLEPLACGDKSSLDPSQQLRIYFGDVS